MSVTLTNNPWLPDAPPRKRKKRVKKLVQTNKGTTEKGTKS